MDTELARQIVTFNQWQFDSSCRASVGSKYRELYTTLKERYWDKDISISISGLRRVGKTTILFQLINHLLESGVSGKEILYFQFSEKNSDLNKVLQIYFAKYSTKEMQHKNFYIFLDELQYVADWQSILKSYIDRNKQIKFIVTGSASIYFRSQVRESLAGRILDFTLDPLSFSEMLRLTDNFVGKYSFAHIIASTGDKEIDLKKLEHERLPYQSKLLPYLTAGEFPALLPYLSDRDYCRKYLRDGITEKILQKDIKLFEVEKDEEIAALHRICCSNMAQVMNLTSVATETGLSYPTIKKYILVLEKTFLIQRVMNRLRSVRAQVKALDKVFSTSINLACATLSIDDPLNPPYLDFRGHIIENFAFNSVKNIGKVYYYNNAGKEVDIILEIGNVTVPIEVKSAGVIKKTDTNHLRKYMEKFNLTEGYLIYGGEIKKIRYGEITIYLLPYWLL